MSTSATLFLRIAGLLLAVSAQVAAAEGFQNKNQPRPVRMGNVPDQGADAAAIEPTAGSGEAKNTEVTAVRAPMPAEVRPPPAAAAAEAVPKNRGTADTSAERRSGGLIAPPYLAVGTRVVAVVDGPSDSDCIMAGNTGTVYCFDPNDPSLPYLVNWDVPCGMEQCGVCNHCAPNGWWVGFHEIRVFLPIGTRVVAFVDHPAGNSRIPLGAKGTVYCYDEADHALPYLINWDLPVGFEQCQICGNCAPHGWWVGFDDVSVFLQGVRVVAKVDDPAGNACIGRCAGGTIVCYDPNDPVLTYLVAWDPACGYTTCAVCDACTNQGWWVGFEEIGLEIPRDFDGDWMIDTCDPDIDNDGYPNGTDVCDWTPIGAWVGPDGGVPGDLDGDCDVDLSDYAILEAHCTGPSTH